MLTIPLTIHVTIDLPAPKRRKTIAGSLVSTALSAALIGTAVGLTVYRLWKGKAKQSEDPPPYEPGEWVGPTPEPEQDKADGPHYVPVPDPDSREYPESDITSPSLRQRRQRHVAGRRTAPRHRKVPARTQPAHAQTINLSPPQPSRAPIPPEFNFPSPAMEEDTEADASDQMDWIGDRLSRLIEEGKRALGKEIVVMSETKEDEEDDGTGQWVEDDGLAASSSSGALRSGRSKRPRSSTVSSPPPQYTSRQSTPRTPQTAHFESQPCSAFSSPGRRSRTESIDSAQSWSTSAAPRESEGQYQSAELREAMERARQQYLQRKFMS